MIDPNALENALVDLSDLGNAIKELLDTVSRGDDASSAFNRVQQLIEAVATLHCDYTSKVLAHYDERMRQWGIQPTFTITNHGQPISQPD
jgi:hypothetical protein